MSPKILSEKAIPLETVRDLLKKRSEVADLNYIQRITLDFGHRFSESFPKSELFIELLGQDFNLTREESIQVININPESIEELNLFLDDKLTTEEKQKILDSIKSHKQKYHLEINEEVPTDIRSSSFSQDEYPDEEPSDSDEE